jgi:hypothetical protein
LHTKKTGQPLVADSGDAEKRIRENKNVIPAEE